MLGLHAMILGPSLVFGFLLLVPWIDRKEPAGSLGRRICAAVGIVLLAGAIGLSVYAAVAPGQQHLGM